MRKNLLAKHSKRASERTVLVKTRCAQDGSKGTATLCSLGEMKHSNIDYKSFLGGGRLSYKLVNSNGAMVPDLAGTLRAQVQEERGVPGRGGECEPAGQQQRHRRAL